MTAQEKKFSAFFENARFLQSTMGITPLMYGSLGLEYLTGEDLHAEDIDILIPGLHLRENWPAFCAALEKSGFRLTDEHEHAFEKDGISYAYAEIEDLEAFAGIRLDEIPTAAAENACFRLLTLGQYLRVYTASARDGYRIRTRMKKDYEKIAFIEAKLGKE